MPAPDQKQRPASRPVPERFLVSAGTLRFDRFMTLAIRLGGFGIIVAVFGILAFILVEVWPLFGSASVKMDREIKLGLKNMGKSVIGLDEWCRKPFVYDGGAEVLCYDLHTGQPAEKLAVPLPEGAIVTALDYDAKNSRVILGTSDGRIGSFRVEYTSTVNDPKRGGQQVSASLKMESFYPIGQTGRPLSAVSFGDGNSKKLLAAIQDVDGKPEVHVVMIEEKRTLMGSAKPSVTGTYALSRHLKTRPVQLLASHVGDNLLVVDEAGDVHYLFHAGSAGVELRQTFRPFAELSDPKVASIGYVFGDVSVLVTSTDGHQKVFSLYIQPVERDGQKTEMRLYGQTKEFPQLPGPPAFFASSLRNKTVLTGTKDFASLRYITTEKVRWEEKLPFQVAGAQFDAKAEHIVFLDTEGELHRYHLDDPHPEAGARAFFGKIWYEGMSKPEHIWQSTSGTDDFEPKYSLTPLIVGSLKGTLYALLFALPIALLAAVYTACFLPPEVKTIVKPVMEIMASLPSVVLGFLAGLWLAPLVEEKVPSVLLTIIALPIAALALGWAWTKVPVETRSRFRPGSEYWLMALPIALVAYVAWSLGPWLESWAFTVTDKATGQTLGDFRLWWPQFTGATFDQRNSLVVGFMMGFAVIPIIFTISEDALSNVPPSLRAASMALGANRWQVVRSIVLPIASPGIFSALMVGFGRAVGETMIVVMATGNTPVMDLNIFSGMRTLSANIAVELPEAAVHSTHYRALFLGALVLFLLTFVLNTIAEVMRQRLRDKYKLV
jgi:phosphate transport system permease protein